MAVEEVGERQGRKLGLSETHSHQLEPIGNNLLHFGDFIKFGPLSMPFLGVVMKNKTK